MHRKHSSDALLMARLDGELSLVRLAILERHLQSCWKCRARSTELEAQAERIAKAFEQAVCFATPRTLEAKHRFSQAIAEIEPPAVFPRAIPFRRMPSTSRIPALTAALVLGLGLAGVYAYHLNAVGEAERRVALTKPKAALRPAATPLPPAVESDALRSKPPSVGTGRQRSEIPAASIPARPDIANLDAVEMEVHYILHQHRACRGEAVEVRRIDGRVVLEGVLESEQRKQELATALGETLLSGAVSLDLKTVSDAVLNEAVFKNAGDRRDELLLKGRAPAKLPVEMELERYFSSHPESRAEWRMPAIANDTLSLSGSVLDDGWALRRLARRFGFTGEPRSARVQEELMSMARDHIQWMSHDSGQIALRLAPLFSLFGRRQTATPHPAGEYGNWPEACENLFQQADRLHAIAQELFAGSDDPAPAGNSADSGLAALEAALSALHSDTEVLLTRWSGQMYVR